jgi:hypothetical protein
MKLILEPVMQNCCSQKRTALRRLPKQTSGSCLAPFFPARKRKLPQ